MSQTCTFYFLLISFEKVNFGCYGFYDSFEQMMLSAFASFSKALGRGGTSNGDSRHWSYNQELGGNLEEMVPDGTFCLAILF